jgi:hypothetical protein
MLGAAAVHGDADASRALMISARATRGPAFQWVGTRRFSSSNQFWTTTMRGRAAEAFVLERTPAAETAARQA